MDERHWFRNQLEAEGDALIWAVGQVPEERRNRQPPEPLGEWSALRHAFHMSYNERHVVLPRLRLWLDTPTTEDKDFNEESAWQDLVDKDSALAMFQSTRDRHIEFLNKITDPLLDETRETTTGSVPLRWVLTKSIQHTADHINGILRIALFWDRVKS